MIGERVATLRRSAGQSQGELAAAVGRPQSFIAKVELGARRLAFAEAAAIAASLGVDLVELAAGLGERDANASPILGGLPRRPRPRRSAQGSTSWATGRSVPAAGSQPEPRAWASPKDIADAGFAGFTSIRALTASNCAEVPPGPGVYLVVRLSAGQVRFRSVSPGGRFKDRDPSEAPASLRARWIAESPVLYIGKADALRRRIGQLLAFGGGRPAGHWGGRAIWQIAGSSGFLVAWRESASPLADESALLAAFSERFGALPFGNRRR